ncbi:Hydrogenase maturation factor HypC [Georgfuchsia toluolica]|uniref:Hydrogenase maturation factor HypC n=2 Tax=Georgfuchsia toluolica TaxID=424218 RepID=A0A916J1R9_9PROT|nr:Hydrogenase maturation factor HypC [Georgfuchsia toluolica]
MCMAVPSRIVALDGVMATVESYGCQRQVSLMLLDEEVSIGDYLLVRAGGLAFERIEAEQALQALALMDEIAATDGGDVHTW